MKQLRKCLIMILLLVAAITVLTGAASAANLAYGAATINATSLNIRSGPATSYDKVATVAGGSRLVVLEKTSSEWYKVNYNGVVGYVDASYLRDVLDIENFNASGTITATDVNMRSKPTTDSSKVECLAKDTAVEVIGINKGWYKVVHAGTTGYVRSDLMEVTGAPSSSVSSAASSGASETGLAAVNLALKYLGYSYVYGAESPKEGFDCSGLVYYVYGQLGYDLQRTASQQYKTNGTSVSKENLKKGDLVFFSSNGYSVTHVGIYIGDNQFVHASTSNTGVIISDLTSAYYSRVWFGAKRIA